ncbi:hypothetical protein DFH09DRAFT_1325728 [Mycena vulgaris]|nr:hypothetical protein DFH09DRAFT_1325728 [Mycena vulgaris]
MGDLWKSHGDKSRIRVLSTREVSLNRRAGNESTGGECISRGVHKKAPPELIVVLYFSGPLLVDESADPHHGAVPRDRAARQALDYDAAAGVIKLAKRVAFGPELEIGGDVLAPTATAAGRKPRAACGLARIDDADVRAEEAFGVEHEREEGPSKLAGTEAPSNNLAAPTYLPLAAFLSLTPPTVLSLAEIQILFRRRPADHHFGLHLVHLILGLLQVGMRRAWDDEKPKCWGVEPSALLCNKKTLVRAGSNQART